MMKKKAKKIWDKIIVNVPKDLLNEFDSVSATQYYSRSEALKEAMRQFIIEQAPEDYVSPNMREQMKEQSADAFEAMTKGIVRSASDPEVQKNSVDKNVNLDRLPHIVKKLKEHNIDCKALYMIGFPGETRAQIQKTVDLALNLGIEDFNF